MSQIKYLIKFIVEETFIDSLIKDGTLFMRSAEYFISLEQESGTKGKGDSLEAIVFNCMRIGLNHPIYCMYSVFTDDVCTDGILINKKMVADFCPQGKGYFALIEFDAFMERIQADCYDDGFYCNKIHYGKASHEFETDLFIHESYKIPFFKHSFFSHQQEYRILLFRELELVNDDKKREKFKNTEFEHCTFLKYGTYTKHIGNLSDFARKLNVENLEDYNEDFYILKRHCLE